MAQPGKGYVVCSASPLTYRPNRGVDKQKKQKRHHRQVDSAMVTPLVHRFAPAARLIHRFALEEFKDGAGAKRKKLAKSLRLCKSFRDVLLDLKLRVDDVILAFRLARLSVAWRWRWSLSGAASRRFCI